MVCLSLAGEAINFSGFSLSVLYAASGRSSFAHYEIRFAVLFFPKLWCGFFGKEGERVFTPAFVDLWMPGVEDLTVCARNRTVFLIFFIGGSCPALHFRCSGCDLMCFLFLLRLDPDLSACERDLVCRLSAILDWRILCERHSFTA